MTSEFEVTNINTNPKDTGVSQYITIEVDILQISSAELFANASDPEIYSGESVGKI